MTSAEKMLKPTDKVVLFYLEKRQEVYEEILHHFQITSITVASCGRLQLLQACVKLGIKCLALCRNAAHLKLLKDDLLAWMFEESLTNECCYFYLKRKDLIDQLGLEPDVDVPGTDAARSQQRDDLSSEPEDDPMDMEEEGAEEENAGDDEEAEEEEQGQEEEQQQEEPGEEQGQEEQEQGQEEPPPKKPRTKSKAKSKAEPKGKAKSKAEPKGKAVPKGKAGPKGKAAPKGKAGAPAPSPSAS